LRPPIAEPYRTAQQLDRPHPVEIAFAAHFVNSALASAGDIVTFSMHCEETFQSLNP